ncbi:hypothetical protein GPECTOR_59g625 [Gonium pectorale]|uniref:Thioredoxin domain-containing protein n=1 Tax=Gonium pectorale TaxID=33097 RepID=A0A150G5C3_GONPE|nr:hypothetical protein GPECTOR_59g625 [Gonium pectorale]|eukprot:KXZ45018.1 hypothetical protein GPECTOR_59g625 [Gonium pectorale]
MLQAKPPSCAPRPGQLHAAAPLPLPLAPFRSPPLRRCSPALRSLPAPPGGGAKEALADEAGTADHADQAAAPSRPISSPAGGAAPSPAPTSSQAASGNGGTASSGGNGGVQAWLSAPVPLPGGYRTSRRDVLKLGSLAGAAGCFYTAFRNAKAMSYASPQALLNALLPPPAPAAPGDASGDRVAAFKRYIADLERRGGGREVPEFPAGADWLNSAPLRLAGPPSARGSLAGRVTVLDFWTYCCINCIHVLPDLAQLESQFAGAPVAVVGVHSAKFDNEKDSSAIRAAVLRYDISHPVVNDRSMSVWGALGVSSWPTLAVVSPRGRLIAMLSGEGHRQDLEDLINAALQYYGEAGELDGSTPLPIALERNKQAADAASPLRYPGKIAADLAGGRLFISDSNNHRIVITDLAGRFLDQIGGGTEHLYIALAGQHQIWDLQLAGGIAGLLSGSGSERNQNGPTPFTTSWAQPSGLSLAGDGSGLMYVADSESSSVRVVDLGSGGGGLKAGGDPLFSDNLFRFGDKDGFGPEALLQHPLAVLSSPDGTAVYVADSYNHRIKVLYPSTNEVVTIAGSGTAGLRDGVGTEAQFSEPAGLCLGPNGTVFVADTNNGAIRILDPVSRRVSTLALTGVPPPRVDPLAAIESGAGGATGYGNGATAPPPPAGFQVVRAERPLAVGAGGGSFTVTVGLPPGYHLTAGAGSSYYTQLLPAAGGAADVTAVTVRPSSGALPDTASPSVTLAVTPAAAAASSGGRLVLRLLAKVYYCQQNDVCLFEQICFEVPLELESGALAAAGQADVRLQYNVVPAATPSFVLQ